jgi:hypothetical protein
MNPFVGESSSSSGLDRPTFAGNWSSKESSGVVLAIRLKGGKVHMIHELAKGYKQMSWVFLKLL